MKFTAVLFGLAAVAAANPIFERAQCNKDNCNRAVNGNRAVTTAKADCKSYMQYTMTPSPIWSTVTVDHKVPARIGIVVQNSAVTVKPTAVPTYASACSATGQYLSACSCLGMKTSMTTMPTPTHTVYVQRETTDA